MRKIVAMAVICLTAASGLTSAYAAQLADDEAGLRIRLKNELRRADKPSAGAGRDIYAWVQGGLLDFNSRQPVACAAHNSTQHTSRTHKV